MLHCYHYARENTHTMQTSQPISNLSLMKTRAEDIKRSLDQLIQILQFSPERLQWSDALDRFAVLNIQIQHLSEQIRPVLRHYTIRPLSVNNTNAPIIPTLLATRLTPEMEDELASLQETTTDIDILIRDIAVLNTAVDSLANSNKGPLNDPKKKIQQRVQAGLKGSLPTIYPSVIGTGGGVLGQEDGCKVLVDAVSQGKGLT